MPQIPIRLQLLNSGKLETALFYEPLLTLIEQKGGRVVWDDRKLNEPLSMTTPRPRSTCRSPLKKRLVPDAVAKDYRLPKFGRRPTADGLPALPTEAEVSHAAQWLVRRGILKSVPDISGVVCR